MSEGQLLTALVEAEHAAVYGYGVLGARLDDGQRREAVLARDGHRARRDTVVAALGPRGLPAPAPAAAYDLTVNGPVQALTLAVKLEEGLALRWRDLVSGTDAPELRRLGVAGLTETAVRAAKWRRLMGAVPPTVALPGA